ncbi:PTS glucose transporter subunit IIA [Actinomycetaceae bacterium L2_0104]
MAFFKKKAAPTLVTVADGDVVALDKVNDPVFASKTIGDGYAVNPTASAVVSPVEGEILSVFPTKHAITMRSKDGLEILIHMGIDTVSLKGEGFDVQVAKGHKVTSGQALASMDLDYILQQGKETTIMVLVTNLDGKGLKLTEGSASAGDPVLEVK